MNVFVTGTDTDAGKTTVSAWICSKIKTKYWKLIQTGSDSDASSVKNFAPNTEIIPEIYKLKAPLSAYDAAKIENIAIDTEKFRTDNDKIVIEGAGGLFVPIGDSFLMIDAIKSTNSAALLVTRSKLGMINHLLLSISALKNQKIPIVGIIVCGNIEENIKQTIEHFSGEKILTVLHESENLAQLFANTSVPSKISEILS
ncbi:MAG: dethiobiotin synthase [Alphaproteobacteria bacterium]|nr:dethiobiotin synthase [Alphaproteobacteria bacterium]